MTTLKLVVPLKISVPRNMSLKRKTGASPHLINTGIRHRALRGLYPQQD